jgi:hypothetical protein
LITMGVTTAEEVAELSMRVGNEFYEEAFSGVGSLFTFYGMRVRGWTRTQSKRQEHWDERDKPIQKEQGTRDEPAFCRKSIGHEKPRADESDRLSQLSKEYSFSERLPRTCRNSYKACSARSPQPNGWSLSNCSPQTNGFRSPARRLRVLAFLVIECNQHMDKILTSSFFVSLSSHFENTATWKFLRERSLSQRKEMFMMSDKIALVTGANTGMGKVIATELARQGTTSLDLLGADLSSQQVMIHHCRGIEGWGKGLGIHLCRV